MESPVGMTRWNLLGWFLARRFLWKIILIDCHMQATSPSCCLPEAHVDRALRSRKSWHVLACLSMHRCCCKNFWSCFRRSTDMFDFCFFDMFVRSYPDMFWHVWTCAVAVAITFDLGCLPGALQLNGPHEMICPKWQKRIVWRQPSPDNLHPTCHGGDHSK